MKIVLPKVNPLLQPLIDIIPLQLIAYYVAKYNKCDIDKPRNLAKSVTVE
jgi:glucosamine--fructose-6-phosphate aminotransferase (isomerizing)